MRIEEFIASIVGLHEDEPEEGCDRCAALETIVRQICTLDAECRAPREVVDGLRRDNPVLRAKIANAESGVLGAK